VSVALVDPSLFTIPYDCELVYALDQLGEPTTLYGRPLRPGEAFAHPVRIVKHFYQLSERLPKVLRRPIKGVEHGIDMALLISAIRSNPPMVIHFQWCPVPIVDAVMVKRIRAIAPVVMTVHDPNPYNGAEHRIMRKGATQLPSLFDAVIVHTRSGKEQIIMNGIDPDRVHVVPHGLLALKTVPSGTKSHPFTIVFFGKIKPYKGLDTLIEALSRLSPTLKTQLHLMVVGEPAMDITAIRKAARGSGIRISWELRFVGDNEIDFWLRQSDLFVFPYRDIDASGVFMSCLRYAKPMIATRIGMFDEILQHGTHGYLIEASRSAEALADAIETLVRDPELAHRMGMAVGRLVDTLPSWLSIARSTLNVYSAARENWQRETR
jgi:glycosyltransferase involved in cell wall biosynthesis